MPALPGRHVQPGLLFRPGRHGKAFGRAERRVVTLANRSDTAISEDLVVYLNRLSDWLFVVFSLDTNFGFRNAQAATAGRELPITASTAVD